MKKNVPIIIITVLFLIGLCVAVYSILQKNITSTGGITLSDKASIDNENTAGGDIEGDFVFNEKDFDFGIVKQGGGVVKHDFSFQYKGKAPVTITGLPTSCGCTEATISSKTLKPEDTGVITVTFDPNLHEEPEGKFYKTISILSQPQLSIPEELKIWVQIEKDLGPDAYKLKTKDTD